MANSSPRKQMRGRRHLPDVPVPRAKVVSFKDDVVETSIGGTQTVAKMKGDPLVPVSDGTNVDRRVNIPSQSQSSTSTVNNAALESQSHQAKIMESSRSTCQAENKENVEKMGETKTCVGKSTQRKHNTESETGVFASPALRPARTALLAKEFEKFTPAKSKPDSHRRTTEEYLDEVSNTFMTPPQLQYKRRTLESEMFATPDCYRVVHLETPQKSLLGTVSGTDDSLTEVEDGENSCSITVAVRVRPYSQRELSDASVKCVVSMRDKETTVTADNGSVHRFAFDFSFWSFDDTHGDFSNQGRVYTSLAQPLLGKAFEGYNTCLFAYGQTGSGKSYSIMGHGADRGIIPRFCEELFSRATLVSNRDKVKMSVEISFFEIYNEKIHDLLACSKEKNGKKATLKVREHPVLGPYVEGLSTFVVNSFEDVEGWITLGTKNRATAATGMNDKSSRSHSVFTIVLTQTRTERVENQDHDHSITSKINLVDLAGSERQSQAQTSGERLREGANINKSLLTLGKVISLLSERSAASKKQRKIFIPYRDSVLTWLLKESLGGNSKTAMIATISPSHHHVEETLSTLRYARQTRSIVNLVRVNEDPKAKIIRELRAEIEKLRRQSGTMNEDSHVASMAEIAMLKDKLTFKEREMDELTRSWQERLRQAEARKQEESKQLEKSGVAAMKVDNQLPNLVNLNEDPQLSELLLYVIKTGQTRVGRKCQDSTHDIQLSGALIADNHCIINNMEGIVNITPIGDAPTYVNGNLITEPTTLHHADRVILGGDHYFRFNHPMEVKNKRGSGSTAVDVKDFEFAKQELLQVQEANLQEELEEAQKLAQAKMEEELERARREAEEELHQQRSGYEDKLAHMEKTLKEQSLEVKRAMQSKQEAHCLIEDLRKQKMMLEQEVLAGRRRQQLEAEAAQKVNSKLLSNKSRILELLESERSKAAARLDELRQRRAEMTTPTKSRRGGGECPSSVGIRKDLYKVALLLREANKISQYLKKDMVFSREDVEEEEGEESEAGGSQILIKVTNTRHRIFTHWTVARLEEKVVQMRDLYQNEGDSSADDDEVFNDPEDNWEKENPSPFSSPASNGCLKSPLMGVGARSAQLNTSATASPSLKRASFGMGSSVGDSGVSWYKACRKMVSTVMDQFGALSLEESVADKILWDCHVLQSCVSAVPQEPEGGSSSAVMQLVISLQHLATHCAQWAATCDRDTPLVHDLLSQQTEHVRAIAAQVSHLLQGFETELKSLVQEASSKLSEEVLGLCRTCGQLALATKARIVRLEQFTQDSASSQLRPEVCQAFLSGCDRLLDRTLQRDMKTLEHHEGVVSHLSDSSSLPQVLGGVGQGVGRTVACTRQLLQACQEVQVEVDCRVVEGRRSTSSLGTNQPQYCHAYYRRLQDLHGQVSHLADTAGLLVQETKLALEGEYQDLRRIHRCAELIRRRSQQLLHGSCPENTSLSLSLLDSSLSPQSSHAADSQAGGLDSRCSHMDSVSILSDSQTEHVDFAAQEVIGSCRSLMERVEKVISPKDKGAMSAWNKRMLPALPSKLGCSPVTHRQQASARRNVAVTSSAEDS